MDDPVRVTYHARRRLKERVKLPHRAAKRVARLAMEHGQDENHPDLTPFLRAKMHRARRNSPPEVGPNGVYRLYRGSLYIFSELGALITVIDRMEDHDGGKPQEKLEGTHFSRGERKGVPKDLSRRLRAARRGDYEGDDE